MGTPLSLHCHFQKKKVERCEVPNKILWLVEAKCPEGGFALSDCHSSSLVDYRPWVLHCPRTLGPFSSTNQKIALGTSHRSTFFPENDSVMCSNDNGVPITIRRTRYRYNTRKFFDTTRFTSRSGSGRDDRAGRIATGLLFGCVENVSKNPKI